MQAYNQNSYKEVDRMRKRVILLVTVFMMLVNICASANIVNSDYEMLYNLGIVNETYDVYEGKSLVTHEEFIASLIGMVAEEVPEDKVLEFAQSRNIVSSINSNELKSAISYERALSLVLNALGYAGVIKYDGNNSEAVRKYANECELTKGVTLNFGDMLDGKSMVKILANALEADMLNAVMSDKVGLFERSDKNPLEAYREIKEITGRITHTNYTSLYGEKGVDKNKIGIDDVIYDIGYEYDQELIGQTVKAYVREDVVFHVEPRNSKVKKIEIEGKDILSITDDITRIEFEKRTEKGSKIDDLDLNPALTVIYNGRNYTGYTKEDLIPTNGKIVCWDLDNDKKYDIVYVYSYETIVVKNVSTAYKTIGNVYNLPGGTKTLDLDEDYTDVKIYKNGQEVTLASIAVDNVLSVAKSKGSEPVLRIYVGDGKVSGTVYSFDRSESIVKLGDMEYEVNKTYIDAANAEGSKIDGINLGNLYDFYLDTFGKIAYGKRDKLEGYEYALIFKLRWDIEKETARARVLNVNDEWEDLYFAEKVRLNDNSRTKAEVVFNLMGGKELAPKLVLIKRDAEGNISAIKEATVSNEYGAKGFTKTTEYNRNYWTGDSSFNCRHYLSYDAIVLLKPNDDANKFDEEQYEFSNVGYFSDWQQYQYIAYNVDEFGYPDLFEVRDTKNTTTVTLYVNDMISALNEYGEAAKLVTGNLAGLENLSLFEIPGSITANIKAGDIANVKLRNGKIIQLDVVYSVGREKSYKVPVDDYTVHNGGTEVWGDVVAIDMERGMMLVDGQTEIIPIFIQSKAEIEIFDKNERKWIIGSLTDIYEGNYVRITMGNNQVNSVVVFQ